MGVLYISDFINKKFNSLTIIGANGHHVKSNGKRLQKVLCKCDCGNYMSTTLSKVKTGHTTSCGCLGSRHKIGDLNKRHGLSSHSLYAIWNGIIQRCENCANDNYKRYGGRGIKICIEWRQDFKVFYDWCMFNGWRQGLQIDRRENNGHYEPDNCRCVTAKINSRNRRDNTILEIGGIKMVLAEAVEKGLINKEQYYRDLKKGLQ